MHHYQGDQLSLLDESDWQSLPSPKMKGENADGVQGWAHAYAGYSLSFAQEAVKILKSSNKDRFLDPFIGSGTSALAFAHENVPFYGVDIDPFSALLTRAKIAIAADPKKVHAYIENGEKDIPAGFSTNTSELFHINDLKYALCVIDRILAGQTGEPLSSWKKILNDPKGLYDSEVVALASITIASKKVAKMVRGSNPVWLRKSLEGELEETPPLHLIAQQLSEQMLEDLSHLPAGKRGPSSRILNCPFQASSIRKNSIDCVVTSPPYLNRLDYIVNHLPEISVLSCFFPLDVESLRSKIMGTTKMTLNGEPLPEWGQECTNILEKIRNHPSKASSTYYYKFHYQYFYNLKLMLDKLRHCCKETARGLLVVQDSYYKDIRIPIAQIFEEMGKSSGINISEVRTEEVRGHMGAMSPTQKAYVPSKVLREHVLFLGF